MNAEKLFLLGLTTLMGIIAWFMVRPFLGYVLGAFLLAFLLFPVHRVTRRLLGSRISAFTLIIFALILTVLPVWIVSAAVLQDAQDLPGDLNESDIIDTNQIEEQILMYTGRTIDIESSANNIINEFTSAVFGNFSQILDLATNLFIGFTLMMFLGYYLLRDGEEFVEWTKTLMPVSEEVKESLYGNVRQTTWAVIKGHVSVSIAQAGVAGLALYLTGVPNPVFWTFIMIIAGFVPVVGAAAVWVPASIYLFLVGRPGPAIFLFLYGALVVGLVDNIVRPLAVDRSANLHPAVVIIGVIGGVFLFGAAGLFIGPIILGVLKAALLVFGENYR